MITLQFTMRQVRSLLQDCASDRLGDLLLKQLLPPDDLSEFRHFIKTAQDDGLNYMRNALRERPQDKINLIKMLRKWSQGNKEFLDQFPEDDTRWGDVLCLAAAKTWVENNWDELIK